MTTTSAVALDHEVADTWEAQSFVAPDSAGGFAWLEGQLPPGIALGEQSIHVSSGPDPGRVTQLQVEATAGEDRGEVEFPVEEALPGRDLFADPQPRMACKDLADWYRPGEAEVEFLGGVQVVPADVAARSAPPFRGRRASGSRPSSAWHASDPLIQGWAA